MRARCASASCVIRAASTLLIFLLILASSALASEPKFPPLTGRVVDDAAVLSDTTKSDLTDMLAAHEQATGQQVVVVTLDSLQGYTIEDYGYQLGRNWGIGQKGKNTGAILIVAPKEHKVRIEVGYGLEGTLTDAISRTIIENSILPNFKRGDFNAGVLAGTTSILRALGGNSAETGEAATSAYPIQGKPPSGLELVVIILFFLIPVIGSLLLTFGFISSGHRVQWGTGRGWDSGGGLGGGSSGGGGGFSGGGGSFGGGGASGSW
jgi:uncharacterized protein